MDSFWSVVLLLICLACGRLFLKFSKKSTLYRKAIRHLQGAPSFSPEMQDCYVKFYGRVDMPNQNTSTLFNKACVLYQTKVVAEWVTKLKKPSKGTTLNRKTLYTHESTQPVELELVSYDGQRVQLNFKAFEQSGGLMNLNSLRESSRHCPSQCADKAQAKYTNYGIVEKWLCSQDDVLVYGKLQRRAEGQLSLLPTGLGEYPTVLQVVTNTKRNVCTELDGVLSRTCNKMAASGAVVALCLVFLYLINSDYV